MSSRVFITLNEDVMTELLRKAERRVCYAGPGIYDWVAEALIGVSGDLGPENVSVIVDPDPFVMQVGYGTEQALRRLYDKGIPVRVQQGLRIGIVIADDFAAVFASAAAQFETRSITPTVPGPYGAAVGDFNHDGNLDLVVTTCIVSNEVTIMLGNGDGTFRPPVSYPVSDCPDVPAVGDFNRDGNLDI